MTVQTKRRPRLRDELRKRFKTPEALLSALGMDSNIAGLVHAEKSRSVLDDEGARQAAMHGRADLGDQDMDDGAWDEEGPRSSPQARSRRSRHRVHVFYAPASPTNRR